MAEQPTNLLAFYQGWDAYQALLIKAIAPLSSEQLALRVAPHLRSIGKNVAHIISGRVGNFHLALGEGGAELAPLEEWDLLGVPPRSAVELVRGLEATWLMIHTALVRWTPANLDDVFVEVQDEQPSRFTRQWIIWSTIKHDLHHGGEVSFTLGTHHVEALAL
ncbi:MAG: DinB family protein [Ktedonobacteraceae bacterium]